MPAPVCATQAGSADSAVSEQKPVGGGYAVTGQVAGVGYASEIYDASNALPTSDANYILAARDGYLWVGGYSGIFRYDGRTFERLDTSGGLTSGRGLFEDSRGRIWVGTNDNGVVVIDGVETTHITYKEGLPSSSIRIFAEDMKGDIYVGTTSGLCYVDDEMNVRIVDDARINNERILRLVTDCGGMVYGQTRDGLVFSVSEGRIGSVFTGEELGMEKITSILADPEKEGYLYYATEAGMVYHGVFGQTAKDMDRISATILGEIHWISYDCGRIWLASTSDFGYLDESGRFHRIDHTPLDSGIEMMTSDYQGNMWFASSTQGVMKIVTSNFSNLYEMAGMDAEVVNAVCRFDGRTYIGTDEGLRILDMYMNPVEDLLTGYLKGCRVRCMTTDRTGNLWIATYTGDRGLVRADRNGRFTNFTIVDGMPGNQIRCVTAVDDGSVLVGTNSGLAVIKDGEVIRTVGAREGIRNTVFLTVVKGDDGNIYAGSDGDGIYVISDSSIRRIGRDEGLTSDVILRIKPDEQRGLYWVITSNSIMYLKDGALTLVTSFPFNNNYDIFSGSEDRLWILSSYGLYSVNAGDMISDRVVDYKLYTVANGLPGAPTSNSYGTMDEHGNLYIPSRNGVGKIDTAGYQREHSEVNLDVSSVYSGNERIYPDQNGVFTIPATDSRIRITPAILDYSMENPTIKVFLEGAADEGITVERNRLSALEYTGLDFGNYKLHIQVIDSIEDTVLQEEIFDIVKKPRFYELTVTKAVIIVLLVLIIGFIIWRIMNGTIIRKQYRELRDAKDEAERANLAKSRFLANISHEIRTPINTIMGVDELILREDSTDVPKGYFLSILNYALDIRKASQSLLTLINNLLDMSMIESGKMSPVEEEYDTVDFLSSIVALAREMSRDKQLTFDTDIDESLPKRIYGDQGKIRQILLNLISNAAKYTSEGGFALSVFVEKKTKDECRIRFSVKDTGVGIRQEDLDKIFNAYDRLGDANGGQNMGGLGLDISRQFADILGGTLSCESSYGKGSEFTLTITQKIVDRDPIGRFSEKDESGPVGPYVPKFIAPDADVLIVDDNPLNLRVIKELLKFTKMFVSTAESGEECLEKVKYGSYDVVLLDHMMPGMDGVETLSRIRKDHPDLPVYALTANSTAGEEFYLSKGFNGYLTKPLNTAVLEETILKHLPKESVMIIEDPGGGMDLDSIPEDMEWIRDIPGISAPDGIRNSGGISPFINALRMFHDTVDIVCDVIERAHRAGDHKQFAVKIHSLSVSANIVGALKLVQRADELEKAADHQDIDFINEHLGDFLMEYGSFKEKLSRLSRNDSETDK